MRNLPASFTSKYIIQVISSAMGYSKISLAREKRKESKDENK